MKRAVVLLAMVAGCRPGGAIDPGLEVSCSADDQRCPAGRSCNLDAGRCLVELADTAAPQVVSASLELTPPAGTLVQPVTAARAGTRVRVSVTFDEPLSAAPQLEVTPLALTFTATGTGASWLFEGTPAMGAPGCSPCVLEASAIDGSGNQGRPIVTLPMPGLQVDTTAPAAADVTSSEKIVLVRYPWGSADAGPNLTTVSGGPGAVEPVATVRLLEPTSGLELARTQSDGDGGFAQLVLPANYTELAVEVLDEAGNRSPSARILDVEWVATMGLKEPLLNVFNPHQFVNQPVQTQLRHQRDDIELGAREGLDLPGGRAALVQGAAAWRSRDPVFEFADGRSIAYDAAHARLVAFGGGFNVFGSYFVIDSIRFWDERGWRSSSATGPTKRGWAQVAYDARRRRLVMFGGSVDSLRPTFSDTWELSGETWSRADPATVPSVRMSAAIAYSSTRRSTVMFGGRGTAPDGGTLLLDDTWEWNGVDWAELVSAQHPPAGEACSITDDVARSELVLFCVDQTWALSSSGWRRVALDAGSPGPRLFQAMAYDPRRERTVLTAGVRPNNAGLSDTWEWDGNAWRQVSDAGIPGRQLGMVFHEAMGEVVAVDIGSAYAFDGARWSYRPFPSNDVPAPRKGHAMAYERQRGQVILHGGEVLDAGLLPADTFRFADGVWRKLALADAGPAPASQHVLVGTGPHSVLFTQSGGLAETWSTQGDGGAWMRLSTPPALTARPYAAATWDPVRDGVVLYGGQPPGLTETWLWRAGNWALVSSMGPPRYSHALAFAPALGTVISYGGRLGQFGVTGAMHTLSAAQGWEAAMPTATPLQGLATALGGDGRVYLFGGTDFGEDFFGNVSSTLWELAGGEWRRVRVADPWKEGLPVARIDHAMVGCERSPALVLFGGQTVDRRLLDDTWELHNADLRPSQVMHLGVDAMLARPGSSFRHVRVAAIAGGEGQEPDGGTIAGATLQVMLDGRWQTPGPSPLASNGAPTASPQALELTFQDPRVLARNLNGSPPDFSIAVVPRGTNGTTTAKVSVDYIEVRIGYRLPP